MSKENVGFTPPPYSTRHGVAQISQNFRVTKPFGDRKRPRDPNYSEHQFSSDYHFGVETESSSSVNGSKRVPLSEISTNVPFKYHASRCTKVEGVVGSASNVVNERVLRTDMTNEVETERIAGIRLKIESASDPFRTPVKRTECSNFSDGFTGPSLLDDDFFDESVLQEIDAIVERESMKKQGRPKHDIDIDADSKENDNGDGKGNYFSTSRPIIAGDNLRGGVALDYLKDLKSKEEDTDTSSIMLSGSMPDEYSKYLQSLNDRQREAACSDISTPLMIVAGPGSGKTSTMVGRVLKLLNEGICPSNILAMTFTTAAAAEMRDRIGAVAGKAIAAKITISTFHSFSLQLCRLHAEKLERTADFLVYGHGQQRRAIIEAMRLSENGKAGQVYEACKLGEESDGMRCAGDFKDKSRKWQRFVTQAKASGKTPSEYHNLGDEKGARILQKYNDILRSCNALDYHDMISCSVKLLTDFPEVFKDSQDLWQAIIVDEFQDTSAMQYGLLRRLASHNRITIVGDDDQSIFSFNGADISGFDSFRKDFLYYREIRLVRNYRSTRCIVEAAKYLIQNNVKRCSSKDFLSENSIGSKITVKECYNEVAQCAFVTDKILETVAGGGDGSCSYSNIAVLYRRQVIRAIIAMLKTAFPVCDDGPYRKVFKALLPFEKDVKKKVIEHIEKVSVIRKCSFISAASDIFTAKISGTFRRSQLTQGRKVLSTLDMIKKLIHREQSISSVITSVANMVPQKYLIEQRAVVDIDNGRLLNEDNDLRSVLQYLLDDVSDFLSTQQTSRESDTDAEEGKGCANSLKSFIDYICEREKENFRCRRHDNETSVTLTTIHQSKGLEWDVVFIIKANETEIPLLHEFDGATTNGGTSIEEERRLLYVAMTRARKKLYILYVTLDMNWQMLHPSRFLREIPHHLLETLAAPSMKDPKTILQDVPRESSDSPVDIQREKQPSEVGTVMNNSVNEDIYTAEKEPIESLEACHGNVFLRRFPAEERAIISHLFHQWAKKPAFQNPKRLLDKVGFVIDERLRATNYKHKEVLRAVKSCLGCDEAFTYAGYAVKWEQLPADQRAHLAREKQEHFQKLRMETSMGSSAPTPKQLSYLRTLGCTVPPTSRLHASRLIEHYKSL